MLSPNKVRFNKYLLFFHLNLAFKMKHCFLLFEIWLIKLVSPPLSCYHIVWQQASIQSSSDCFFLFSGSTFEERLSFACINRFKSLCHFNCVLSIISYLCQICLRCSVCLTTCFQQLFKSYILRLAVQGWFQN